jgi:hypothetical protein
VPPRTSAPRRLAGTVQRMGTWGEGAFDNDSAADWSLGFRDADQASGLALIGQALSRGAGMPALRTRDGELAVAAAELVAYMAGQPAEETAYSRNAFDWADRTIATAGPQLVSLALQALAGITGHASEIACLWDEVPSTWPASIAELMAMLLDASPDSGKEQIEQELLPGRFYQSAVKALIAIPDADVPFIYAVSFYFWYEEDGRWPALTIGYNTEARVQRALTGPSDGCFSMPSDEDEARWNYAFWLQNELAVIGDETRDPIGTELIQAWISANGLWYSGRDESAEAGAAADQVDDYVTSLYVRTAQQLHADGMITQILGRPVPILVHELEYYDQIAELTQDANPPGLADAFTTWIGQE